MELTGISNPRYHFGTKSWEIGSLVQSAMAVEILSRQASPVDGLLTLLKSWNPSVFFLTLSNVRGEHSCHSPFKPTKMTTS